MDRISKFIAIGFATIALTGGSLLLYYGPHSVRTEPQHSTVLPSAMDLPQFNLTQHNGTRFTRDELIGSWNLIFFGFTHCPDICPATLTQLAIAKSQLTAEGYETPNIVLVSVDPERDTSDKMAEYLGHFGSDISGLTGSTEEILKLTKALGIFFAKSTNPNGEYSVDHSAAILLIDPNAKWHALFQAPHKIEYFVRDIPILTGAR